MRIDALKELGNIGSAHAITGLSELLHKRVDVAITSVDIIPLHIIYNLFNGPESMVSVVYIEGYSEDFRGMMFLIFPHPESVRLVELATGKLLEEDILKDEYSLSTLREIGNIMCGCYLNADSVLIDLSVENDYALVLETAFTLTDGRCKGFLFFVPTSDSLSMIFSEIGVD
jgi:chemotaxis protein CheC